MTNAILSAAQLIADIDPALSQVWIKSPFQRHNIVTALHRSLLNTPRYAGIADKIAVNLRRTIDQSTQEVAA